MSVEMFHKPRSWMYGTGLERRCGKGKDLSPTFGPAVSALYLNVSQACEDTNAILTRTENCRR